MREPQTIALNMDCMEYMRSLPDKAFDLAVVDPPYGDGSQTVHAERERPDNTTASADGGQSTRWNRFGQRFDRYKNPAGGGITGRTNTTWANADRRDMGQQVR